MKNSLGMTSPTADDILIVKKELQVLIKVAKHFRPSGIKLSRITENSNEETVKHLISHLLMIDTNIEENKKVIDELYAEEGERLSMQFIELE
ncbi:hypothetical protein OH460_08170 [Vibrio sp. Makdt]|uniref:hypothetical protein n=1 Tax=Vibrio sp. Makdt TaxID=2998828 RepID=UPI0022CDADC2|nr:hypothetical protein [Vibrio sp. Makdt]MDA0152274.1 hypothetical protein [Vibrio sp. Makdt]